MSADRLKVVLFTGAGRSGSTLVASLLGELPGFVSVGEATSYMLRGAGRADDSMTCGCGMAVGDCPFWSRVMRRSLECSPVTGGT